MLRTDQNIGEAGRDFCKGVVKEGRTGSSYGAVCCLPMGDLAVRVPQKVGDRGVALDIEA